MSKKNKVPEGFMEFVAAWDDDDLPDGAWQALIMEGVEFYNKEHGTRIDPHDGFMLYVELV